MQTRSAEPIDRCVIWTPRGRHAPEELVGVLEKRGFHVAHTASAHETVGELCALAREGYEPHAAHEVHTGHAASAGHADARSSRPRIIVLIVTDPTNLDHLSAAYSAASEYAPRLETRVACWWFDEPTRRLRAADVSDIARWGAGLEVVVKPGAGKKLIERGLGANRATPGASKVERQGATGAADAKAASSASAPVPPPSPSMAQQADDVAEMFLGKGRPPLRLAGEGTLPPSQEESENPRPGDIPVPPGGMGGMLTGEELAMLLDPDPPGRAFRTE